MLLSPRLDLFVPTARFPCFRQPVLLNAGDHLLAFAEKAIDDEKYGDPVPDPIDPNKPQLRLRTSSFI